jgi:hypothetical protein
LRSSPSDRTFGDVKNRRTISQALLAFIVALMYVATSSTAAIHGLSHGQRPATDNGACDHERVADIATESMPSGDCFFCFHGPAIALVGAPAAPVTTAPEYRPLCHPATVDAPTTSPVLSPPLRAPPTRS